MKKYDLTNGNISLQLIQKYFHYLLQIKLSFV